MTRLRDGTSFACWERWLTALSPGSPPKTLDVKWTQAVAAALAGEPLDEGFQQAAADLCEEGEPSAEPDPHMQTRLAELDAQYLGWWTDLVGESERLETLETMHARRRMFETPGASRPTLPASTLCRAMTIEALAPKRALLLGDADGLGIALDLPEVTAVTRSELQKDWLDAEAKRAESSTVISDTLHSGEVYDVTVADAGTLRETRAALGTALATTREGGHIVLSLRYPWESYVYPLLEASGLELERYLREVNHHLLPGGHVLDGGGDILILRRSAGAELPASEETVADDIRAQPYALIEIESLARDRLDVGAIDRFAHSVEAFAPRPNEMRDSVRDANRDVLWWYDIEGYGFSVELRHDHAHLAIALAPYDPALEYVVLCSAFWTLGDAMTRTYPMRTRRAQSGEVMA